MDAFDRRARRRLRELRAAREKCSHSIGAQRCHTCGETFCAVCQPAHLCKEKP